MYRADISAIQEEARRREAAIRELIRAYDRQLGECDKAQCPADWARLQSGKARAYMQLPYSAENVRRSIQSYDEELTAYDKERFPHQWVDALDQQASAYTVAAIGGDAEGNYIHAIERLDKVFTVLRREDLPVAWAHAQHNRAATYLKLASVRGSDAETEADLDAALLGYDTALTVYTEQEHPEEWLRIQTGKTRIDRYRHPENYPDSLPRFSHRGTAPSNGAFFQTIPHNSQNVARFLHSVITSAPTD